MLNFNFLAPGFLFVKMDSEQRGRESGRGHGHCRGRGRGLPMPSPVIARGPTARGMRFAGPITLEEIRGARSDVLVPVPTPDASTVTGGRGRGREIQAPVATVSTEASGPTDEGIQAPVIDAPRDTDADNAERDPGVPVPMPDIPAAGGRGRGGGIHKPLPNISMVTWDPTDERVQATVCSAPRETGGAVSCSEMEKVSSSPIGSTPLVARGAVGRGKRLTTPSTSSEVDSTPTAARAEKEETSKIVEKELNTVQEMFD